MSVPDWCQTRAKPRATHLPNTLCQSGTPPGRAAQTLPWGRVCTALPGTPNPFAGFDRSLSLDGKSEC